MKSVYTAARVLGATFLHPEDSVAKTDFKTADEYIATFPSDVQKTLKTVRQTIRAAVPDADEVISYQLPAYKLNGFVLYFGGFKDHFSLSCPPPFTVFDVFKKELAPYVVTKSAIRIPLDAPIPVQLIADIARFRAKELLARASGAASSSSSAARAKPKPKAMRAPKPKPKSKSKAAATKPVAKAKPVAKTKPVAKSKATAKAKPKSKATARR